MEAARLETGRVWRGLCAFCKGHDNNWRERAATLLALSYGVMTTPFGTVVAWRLACVFFASHVTRGGRTSMSPINKAVFVF